jgi:hypothetical protein
LITNLTQHKVPKRQAILRKTGSAASSATVCQLRWQQRIAVQHAKAQPNVS